MRKRKPSATLSKPCSFLPNLRLPIIRNAHPSFLQSISAFYFLISALLPLYTSSSVYPTDHHFLREDRTILWQRIANHIAAHPEDLQIALENLDRWETFGRVHPSPIQEWRKRILNALDSAEALQALVSFLADSNHDSEPIKSCSPFVGLPIQPSSLPTRA